MNFLSTEHEGCTGEFGPSRGSTDRAQCGQGPILSSAAQASELRKYIIWHSDQTCLFWICQLSRPKIHGLWKWSVRQNTDRVTTNQNPRIYLRSTLLCTDVDFIHLIFYPVLKIDDHSFFFNGEREILFQKRVWIPFSWCKRKVKRLNTFEFQFLHNSETLGAKAHR